MERELIDYAEAQRLTGLAPHTLRRRLAARACPTFADPRDARRRLVRRSDIEALMQPAGPILLAPRREGRRVA